MRLELLLWALVGRVTLLALRLLLIALMLPLAIAFWLVLGVAAFFAGVAAGAYNELKAQRAARKENDNG